MAKQPDLTISFHSDSRGLSTLNSEPKRRQRERKLKRLPKRKRRRKKMKLRIKLRMRLKRKKMEQQNKTAAWMNPKKSMKMAQNMQMTKKVLWTKVEKR